METIFALVTVALSFGMGWSKQLMYVLPCILFFIILQCGMLASTNFPLFFANIFTFGVLLWYFILQYFNRNTVGDMPENWYAYNTVIMWVTAGHFLFMAIGGFFKQLTWVTMATLVVFVTMQHIISTRFKTDG
jgi:hypothetical protein